MKKIVSIVMLLFVSVAYVYANPQEVSGRSFMFTRPASYNIALNQQLWHNIIHVKYGDVLSTLQIIGYYQRSINQSKIARYFLINGKNKLLVSGDNNSTDFFTRDVRAEWLNLPADFRGKLSLCPQQHQLGFTATYNQDIRKLTDVDFIKDFWFELSLPLTFVQNNLNLGQSAIMNPGTSTPRDIIEAFKQEVWKFSRINGKRSTFRPTELRLNLGRSFLDAEYFQVASYFTLVIPMGNRQNAKYMFDAISGNNRHVSIGGGVNFQVLLNEDPSTAAWAFFINLEGLLLIRNKQLRTFDLKEKPWSRFMLFVEENSPPGSFIPGVNVLTLESIVRPFFIADFTMGWRVETDYFEFEIGYGIWGHGDEDVRLRSLLSSPFTKPCNGTFGIAGKGTIMVDDHAVAATASKSTINRQASDDQAFVPITEREIDFCSAATQSALNHRVHIALGRQYFGKERDGFLGGAYFFELPQKNSALGVWGIWAKIGTSY